MIKCEVIENFTLEKFNELKNVKKVLKRKDNEFGVRDTFECKQEMADYLTGNNPLNKTVVKVIEIEPKKENKEEPKIIETIETSVGTFGYGPVEVIEVTPEELIPVSINDPVGEKGKRGTIEKTSKNKKHSKK